ncbi:MAG: MqnA/MqnD/SBP family protein, partial [Planctomycetota bacterium]
VVTAAPPKWVYPHQLDLGAAWQQWTGLPFVFACWAGRAGDEVGWIAERLDRVRADNAPRRLELARALAEGHAWPLDLAEAYLTRVLRYEIGPRELAGMRRFAAEAHGAGLVARAEPLVRAPASRG